MKLDSADRTLITGIAILFAVAVFSCAILISHYEEESRCVTRCLPHAGIRSHGRCFCDFTKEVRP